MAPMSVGIIGAGLSAQTFHAPFIVANPRFKLASFLRCRAGPVTNYESFPVETDEAKFFASGIELVIITSPPSVHFEQAKAALRAGKHVIVEKPFTVTSAEGEELVKIAETAGKVLAVYHNRRWDGDFLTVTKLIADGKLGRVVEFDSRFERYRNSVREGAWKEQDLPGSGILYDLGSHLVDQALTLFGRPDSVTGHVLNLRQLEAVTDDAFTIILTYSKPHPKLVTLKSTMLAKQPGPRFTVHFTHGTYVKTGVDVQEEQLRARKTPDSPGFGVEDEKLSGTIWAEESTGVASGKITTAPGNYAAFFENVADAVRGGGTAALSVQPAQIVDVIRVIEMARQSSIEGRSIGF
ncbi:hypothetical protein HDU87_001059 [Geranomyces variabilis]|uniref:Oxidoreductase n=1 Tax=Geranomyces variabilis TaxID=109894 RepID=A0AAD5TNB7_9FUNG|nr:hypothetical protein HDU87_001059 [Geranomyces variabilis]